MHLKTLSLALLSAVLFVACSKEAQQTRHVERGDAYVKDQEYAKAEIAYLNALRTPPKNPAVPGKLADVYLQQGRWTMAGAALHEALATDPKNAELRAKLAHALFQLQDFPGSRRAALTVASNGAPPAEILGILAETAITTNDFKQSESIIAAAEKSAPGVGPTVARVTIMARQGDLAGAEALLSKVTTQGKSTPDLDIAWARLRVAQTNLVEAEVLFKRAADAAGPRSIHFLQYIDFLSLRGDIPGAKKALTDATEKVSDFLPHWIRLANLALVERRFEDCDDLTKRALRLESNSHEALLLRARMWTFQGKLDGAIEELTRLDTTFPTNAAVKLELARAHLRAGDNVKAMSVTKDLLRIAPEMPSAIILSAQLNFAANNPQPAIDALVALRKKHPQVREASGLLASAYAQSGRLDEALQIYRDAAARYPNDPEPWGSIGQILMRKGDTAGARAAFEQSLKVRPGYLLAAEQLVYMDVRATNFPWALARAVDLQKLDTNSTAGFALEARVHSAAKDLAAAEKALQKGIERDPNSLPILGAMADLYIAAGQQDKAIQMLDQIISRNTNNFGAWTYKGLLHESRGQKDKAAEMYRRAIAINKNATYALNNLAVIQSQSPATFDEAVTLATRARDSAPNMPEIGDTLGWILFQKKDYAGARRIFNDIAPRSDHPEILFHAGMTDYAMGDETRARERLQKAVADPALPESAKADAQEKLAILSISPESTAPADLQKLEAAAKKDPDDFFVLYRIAAIQARTGKTDAAIKSFEAAAKVNPQSPQAHLALARLRSASEPAKALNHARDARRLSPTDPAVALTLGSLSVRNRDFSAGMPLLLEAQRSMQLPPDVTYDLALAQFANARIADAKETLSSLANASGPAQNNAYQALSLLNDSTAPVQKLTTAETRLKSEPNDLFALAAMADATERQNDARKAADAWQKVVAIAPAHAPAHKRLAILYMNQLNDDKLAEPHAIKARQAMPDDSQVIGVLGSIALKRKQYAEALNLLNRSASGDSSGEPYYLIGVANLGLKRTNDAKIALNKAARLPLSEKSSGETKRLLSELR